MSVLKYYDVGSGQWLPVQSPVGEYDASGTAAAAIAAHEVEYNHDDIATAQAHADIVTGNPHGTTYADVSASPNTHLHAGQTITPYAVSYATDLTAGEISALPIGTRYWDADTQSTALKTTATTTLNDGEELSPTCKNVDTVNHLNGQPVYVSTGTGKRVALKLASASSEATSYAIGVATQDVAYTGSGLGKYCFFGAVKEVPIANVIQTGESDTLWVEGATLYLSTEAGKMTVVRPTAPNHGVRIGWISDKSGANITFNVHVDDGQELGELHDVDLTESKTSPVDADCFLLQDSADSSIWKKLTWAYLKSNLKSYFDGFYLLASGGTLTNVKESITYEELTGDKTISFANADVLYFYVNPSGASIQFTMPADPGAFSKSGVIWVKNNTGKAHTWNTSPAIEFVSETDSQTAPIPAAVGYWTRYTVQWHDNNGGTGFWAVGIAGKTTA